MRVNSGCPVTSRRTRTEVPFSAAQMFALVADIERYPDFLPWCAALRITGKRMEGEREIILADMIVAYRVFRERFTSRVNLDPAKNAIEAEYVDGPFRTLTTNWRFADLDHGGSLIDFFIEFEFRSILLQATAGAVFEKAFSKMSEAFVERAKAVYGERLSDLSRQQP